MTDDQLDQELKKALAVPDLVGKSKSSKGESKSHKEAKQDRRNAKS